MQTPSVRLRPLFWVPAIGGGWRCGWLRCSRRLLSRQCQTFSSHPLASLRSAGWCLLSAAVLASVKLARYYSPGLLHDDPLSCGDGQVTRAALSWAW